MTIKTSYALINPGTVSFVATPEMRKHYEQGGTFTTDNPKLTNDRVNPLTLKVSHGVSTEATKTVELDLYEKDTDLVNTLRESGWKIAAVEFTGEMHFEKESDTEYGEIGIEYIEFTRTTES